MVFGPLAICGTALLLLPVLKIAGLPFFRTNGMVLFVTGGMGASLYHLTPAPLIRMEPFALFLFVLFVYNLRLWFRHPYSSPCLLYAAAGIGAFALAAIALPMSEISGRPAVSLFLTLVLSGLMMGSVALAMLLGHRYLTAPSLSIVPLASLVRLFQWLLYAAIVLVGIETVSDFQKWRQALRLEQISGLYLWIRLLIGLITPVILSQMIRRTVAERATMSATGLLYITLLMVLIGEIFSRFFIVIPQPF